MYRSELEIRVRHEELRRAADRQRLARSAVAGRDTAARPGGDEPERPVRARDRWARIRRATA
ncbi:hypothetical protein GCM10012285_40520 [Streptomyces kronopolitis]|uniref:Uncharacterized protein n=1 Tax=Streptomyces kronopolitis TaxID=1612435 RepID=A0ABQ2JLQ5_9ACTN|nr:hypothetical protein [Streptomyces kronopolitis]GGN50988.1 hypothetical protein GCM10012285_40520 [Streptomyces kronopolitis]